MLSPIEAEIGLLRTKRASFAAKPSSLGPGLSVHRETLHVQVFNLLLHYQKLHMQAIPQSLRFNSH